MTSTQNADNMKKFIKKLVADVKFADAGTGHRLNEERAPKPGPSSASAPAPRRPPSASAQSAGAAALARFEAANNKQNSGLRAQQLEMKRQMQVQTFYYLKHARGTNSVVCTSKMLE